jgi:hypothetical protein
MCKGDAPLYLNLKGRSFPAAIMTFNNNVIQGVAFLSSLQPNAFNPAVRQTASIHFEQHGQQIGSTDLRLEERTRSASGSGTRHSVHYLLWCALT